MKLSKSQRKGRKLAAELMAKSGLLATNPAHCAQLAQHVGTELAYALHPMSQMAKGSDISGGAASGGGDSTPARPQPLRAPQPGVAFTGASGNAGSLDFGVGRNKHPMDALLIPTDEVSPWSSPYFDNRSATERALALSPFIADPKRGALGDQSFFVGDGTEPGTYPGVDGGGGGGRLLPANRGAVAASSSSESQYRTQSTEVPSGGNSGVTYDAVRARAGGAMAKAQAPDDPNWLLKLWSGGRTITHRR